MEVVDCCISVFINIIDEFIRAFINILAENGLATSGSSQSHADTPIPTNLLASSFLHSIQGRWCSSSSRSLPPSRCNRPSSLLSDASAPPTWSGTFGSQPTNSRKEILLESSFSKQKNDPNNQLTQLFPQYGRRVSAGDINASSPRMAMVAVADGSVVGENANKKIFLESFLLKQ